MTFSIATVNLDGGARLGIGPLPGRFGDALADLAVLAKWTPEIVVSMTTAEEMDRHNMGDLGAMLAGMDIAWTHFPVRDFGAPKATRNWAVLSAKLHTVLDAGGGVLLHCYGGQGRSGMVLVRLMVERGWDARTALAEVRAVRPGAVETEAQFQWAASAKICDLGADAGPFPT